MRMGRAAWVLVLSVGCGSEGGDADTDATTGADTGPTSNSGSMETSDETVGDPTGGGSTDVPVPDVPDDLPPPGNPDGSCPIPSEAGLEDVSQPDTVVGDGTPESCTSAATIAAIESGGVITFDCGPDPVTITLDRPAKVFNDTGPRIVIDGGGLVTLSGGGATRILYMISSPRLGTTSSL